MGKSGVSAHSPGRASRLRQGVFSGGVEHDRARFMYGRRAVRGLMHHFETPSWLRARWTGGGTAAGYVITML